MLLVGNTLLSTMIHLWLRLGEFGLLNSWPSIVRLIVALCKVGVCDMTHPMVASNAENNEGNEPS